MKIISWNVNGLRALSRNISIENFVKKYNPDIICFNEIKSSTQTNTLLFNILGYKEQYWNISTKKGYAGTVIFSKVKGIKIEKSPFDKEGRLICVEFPKFYLINLYVPNSGAQLKRLKYRTEEWDKELRKYIKDKQKNKEVIVVGDLNVARTEKDLARPKTNLKTAGYTLEERESFETTLKELELKDTFRELNPETIKYTYWSYRCKCREKNLGWRLDYALVSKKMFKNIKKSEIMDKEVGSDHCPILLELKS